MEPEGGGADGHGRPCESIGPRRAQEFLNRHKLHSSWSEAKSATVIVCLFSNVFSRVCMSSASKTDTYVCRTGVPITLTFNMLISLGSC